MAEIKMAGLLRGVRVLDLTKATSGPFATQVLADLGADVIKVEDPDGTPFQRSILEPQLAIAGGMDPYFISVNRGKRSVVLPLSNPLTKAAFLELVNVSDAVVDNYRPGVAAKLGVDHESLLTHNPRIVTCSISGYGTNGPLSERPAFDLTVLAESGMLDYIDKRDADGSPQYPFLSIADLGAGLYCAIAICAGLRHRDATGTGTRLDVSMFDAVLSLFIGYGTTLLNNGNAEHVSTKGLWGSFATATRPLAISAHRDTQFRGFCASVGHLEWLDDPRFSGAAARARHIDELQSLASNVMATRPADEWIGLLAQHKVPYAEVRAPAEALSSQQAVAREMVLETDLGGVPIKMIGSPIKSDVEGTAPTAPPFLGEHTRSLLKELLGYPEDKLDEIEEAGRSHHG